MVPGTLVEVCWERRRSPPILAQLQLYFYCESEEMCIMECWVLIHLHSERPLPPATLSPILCSGKVIQPLWITPYSYARNGAVHKWNWLPIHCHDLLNPQDFNMSNIFSYMEILTCLLWSHPPFAYRPASICQVQFALCLFPVQKRGSRP